MARPSTTRIDTNHDFIVYKTQTMESNLSQNVSKSRASTIRSRDTSHSNYNLDFESVLAFGGTKRKHRRSQRKSEDPGDVSDLDNSEKSRSSSVSTRNSISASSSMSSTLYDSDEWSDWAAFRAKYEVKHKDRSDSHTYGGRYGVGRGYVEYRHRHDCDGSCQGTCFGK